MDIDNKEIKVAEAAACFYESITTEESEAYQQTINHFARWFGKERLFCEILPTEIANYAERLSDSDAEYSRKLEIIKVFLGYSKKQGSIKINLTTHLKPKKSKAKLKKCVNKDAPQKIALTQESYDKVKTDIEELKKQRPAAIEEISKAAADKDFRENAPLDAARERLSYIEGKLIELQELLKKAEVVDEFSKDTKKAGIGDCIVLTDIDTKEELQYTLVSTREFDPVKGKISGSSPLGKALIGRRSGETVKVVAPAGTLCYKIEKIERKTKSKK